MVTIIIALLLAPLILLTSCFAAEVFLGIRPLSTEWPRRHAPTRAVIVVPAHNEEAILQESLAALKKAAADHARILVVADNCTDSTAEIARSNDVEVIERNDSQRRGKGFALDFARCFLEPNPPKVLLVIDADCVTDATSLEALIAGCSSTGRPCQATNIQVPKFDSSPAVQLSTFAFFIKNVIRQRALQRLAARVQLLGTGMAFPWPIFSCADFATSNIVEDLKLGQELASMGHAPLFVEEATVLSYAETDRNTLSQRSRWEGGVLQNALRSGPALLARSLKRRDVRGAWGAIHLMIPPLALLLTADLLALAVGGVASRASHAHLWPLLSLVAAIGLAGVGLVLAWFAGGSRFVSFGSLTKFPLYLLWKLPMYGRFAARGAPKEWVRTGRDET